MKQSGRVPFIHSFIHSVIHSFIHSFFQPCKPRVQTREPRVQTSFACTNEINSPRVYSREIPLVQTRLRPPAGGGTWEWPLVLTSENRFSHLSCLPGRSSRRLVPAKYPTRPAVRTVLTRTPPGSVRGRKPPKLRRAPRRARRKTEKSRVVGPKKGIESEPRYTPTQVLWHRKRNLSKGQ